MTLFDTWINDGFEISINQFRQSFLLPDGITYSLQVMDGFTYENFTMREDKAGRIAIVIVHSKTKKGHKIRLINTMTELISKTLFEKWG